MKTTRIIIIAALTFGLGVAAFGAAPGGALSGENKDRKKHGDAVSEGAAAAAVVSDAESAALEAYEAQGLSRPADNAARRKLDGTSRSVRSIGEPESAVRRSQQRHDARRKAFETEKVRLNAKKALLKTMSGSEFEAPEAQAPFSNGSMAALIFLALFIPPLAVGIHTRGASADLWINIFLTLFLWIPGIIHAIVVVTR